MVRRLIIIALGGVLALSVMSCEDQHVALPAQGHWRVVNYWAVWCAPCREEIPELNRLHQRTDLVVYAVNYDGKQGAELASQVATMDIEFTILAQDPGQALGVERPRVLPTTLLVNPAGEVTDTLVGPQTEETVLAIWRARAGD
ncbi:TlpA family protein disulfide reductase [Luminiphilus sp.]|nr:TlpA family protein disulfide reductase [Luminiphilus sp.]